MTSALSVPSSVISASAASLACQAAVAHAEASGIRINVAVTDASGTLAAFLRMPHAFLHSIDIAIDKAYTAAGFGLATSKWTAALANDSPAVRQGIPARPRMVAFGGGLPLRHEGKVIGGIGVSGASEQQDEECALAGLAAIGLSAD